MKKFTLKLKQEKIEIEGTVAVITELTGHEREVFADFSSSRFENTGEVDKEGKAIRTLTSVAGINTELIYIGLKNEQGGTFAEKSVIDKWPSTLMDYVSQKIREFSGLVEEVDAEKN